MALGLAEVTGGWILFTLCFIFPPDAFVHAGITVQGLFGRYLGNEGLFFVQHQIRRTVVTYCAHAALVLGYCLVVAVFFPNTVKPGSLAFVAWGLAVIASLGVCSYAAFLASDNFRRHPLAKALAVYGEGDWVLAANRINAEFRRIDKVVATLEGNKVVVTDSWIVQCRRYAVFVAKHSDARLAILSARSISRPGIIEPQQILRIQVELSRPQLPSFDFLLNSIDFEALRTKLSTPVHNARNVILQLSLSDQFLQHFRSIVEENGVVQVHAAACDERCMGCMQTAVEVKVTKRCGDEACRECFCRPMWCVECLGKWFVNVQDANRPEQWLSGHAECPTCRAKFCVRDVLRIQST